MSTKDRILDVAESLFNELGYTAVGVDLIRDKAQVSKTSMYRHFGSKSKLIDAILIRRHQRFEKELGEAVDSAHGEKDKLDAILNWHFNWFKSTTFQGCMFMHGLAEFKGHDEQLAQRAQEHKVWLKQMILSIFGQNASHREASAEAIMALLEGMIIRAEFGKAVGYEDIYRHSAHLLASTAS